MMDRALEIFFYVIIFGNALLAVLWIIVRVIESRRGAWFFAQPETALEGFVLYCLGCNRLVSAIYRLVVEMAHLLHNGDTNLVEYFGCRTYRPRYETSRKRHHITNRWTGARGACFATCLIESKVE
jgi:hypothetical protein